MVESNTRISMDDIIPGVLSAVGIVVGASFGIVGGAVGAVGGYGVGLVLTKVVSNDEEGSI